MFKTSEEKRAYARDYYKKNKDKIREYQKKYVAANPGVSTSAARRWRERNPDREKERQRAAAPQRRSRDLKKKYGITQEQFDSILRSQGGVCAIRGCGIKDGQSGRYGRLHIDHDHKTGRVRGLLCSNHNTALGKVRDDIDQLLSMIEYLKASIS